jgi:sortase A
MQASKKHSFLRRSPLAYVVVPLAFVLVSTALVFIVGHTVLAPYQALLGWFFSTTEVAQPRDLLDNAATVINGGTVDEPDAQPDRLPLSSVTYPSEGDRYATITISGTNVDAPVYYGDTSKILNAGVGTYKDDPRRHSRRGQDHPAGRAQQHLLQ